MFVEPMLRDMTGSVRQALLLLLAAVGVLFLTACVNLANLLLARATHRAQEFSLRASLGATRSRLARQFFAEAIPLAVGGSCSDRVGALDSAAPGPSAACEHAAGRRDRCARSRAGGIDDPVGGRGLPYFTRPCGADP